LYFAQLFGWFLQVFSYLWAMCVETYLQCDSIIKSYPWSHHIHSTFTFNHIHKQALTFCYSSLPLLPVKVFYLCIEWVTHSIQQSVMKCNNIFLILNCSLFFPLGVVRWCSLWFKNVWLKAREQIKIVVTLCYVKKIQILTKYCQTQKMIKWHFCLLAC